LRPGLSNKERREAHASSKKLVEALESLLLGAVAGVAKGEDQASDVLYMWTVCKLGLDLQGAAVSREGQNLHARIRSEVQKGCDVDIDAMREHLEQRVLPVRKGHLETGSKGDPDGTEGGLSNVPPLSRDPEKTFAELSRGASATTWKGH
jgi:hypothetical protein